MKTYLNAILLAVAAGPLCCPLAFGEDAYYRLPSSTMTKVEERTPQPNQDPESWMASRIEPYAQLEGEGEAYVAPESEGRTIIVRAPKDRELAGRLCLVPADSTKVQLLEFKVAAGTAPAATEKEFLAAKESHYRHLLDEDIPGAAWFRHQVRQSARTPGGTLEARANNNRFQRRPDLTDPEAAYGLFSGGRAVSENLQLDRALQPAKPGAATVEVSTLTGITVQEMDWKKLLNTPKAALDPLAAFIPSDQHALFFSTFAAVSTLLDEAESDATPVLQLLETRSEDAGSRGRYQKQLCLQLDEFSRLLGPQMIASVAITGSDPYLRTGTDLGVLLQTKSASLLKTFVMARQATARQGNPAVKEVSGELEGVAYSGVVSPDRAVSSYVAALEEVVLVSNSLQQLGALLKVAKGGKPALASLDEYAFFRQRYAKDSQGETALLILSDATIRRWCGPQWRIADARRTRAAAVLAELQATHLEALVKGQIKPGPIQNELAGAELGELTLTSAGVLSSTYGTMDFLTPIAEMPLTKVSPEEAQAYERWRQGYQANWRQYFDPIAVRFSVQASQLSAELTVMPLIARTEYRDFIALTRGARIAPDSGDRHPEALVHLALAINTQSEPIKQAGNFLGSMNSSLGASPLSWLGQSVALYADKDVIWDELLKAESGTEFMRTNYSRIPVALHVEAKNPLALTAFLAALRAYIEQTAPKMTIWQSAEHNGQAYVKIVPAREMARGEDWGQMSIYYAVTPKSLVVTPSEAVLKRTLDRQAARLAAKAEDNPMTNSARPWLGTNLCLQVDRQFVAALQGIAHDNLDFAQQLRSWNNLPILNEWKRFYPQEDPIQLHERIWKTKLVCPGGGAYRWNEKWRTMESSIYGHPAEPKKRAKTAGILARINSANLGVSFEQEGLSAKVVLEREPERK